jgi:hypothetical protein
MNFLEANVYSSADPSSTPLATDTSWA